MSDSVRARGWRGGGDRSCSLHPAPSRRDFNVVAFYLTLSIMGKRFKLIIEVLKFDLRCVFIAFSARRGKIGPAAYVGAPSRRDFDVEAFY